MFHSDLMRALETRVGPDWTEYKPGWAQIHTTEWRGPKKVPQALVLHHTAAAATDSTSAAHKGNQKGANDGVISFIQSHYPVPAANFTLDRDGTIYVHAAYPIWHAGLGSFRGVGPWNTLGIPDNLGNNYMLGVEIMSKGLKKDFTAAQWDSLKYLLLACKDACGWPHIDLLRRPQHRDWAPTRKVDIKYTNEEVRAELLAV